jgi:DNA-directed RNA polymerase subunit M/transcription elongation factor TFIIS
LTTERDAETAIVDSMGRPIGCFGAGGGNPTLTTWMSHCPKCRQHRMLLARLGAGPSGFANATFECQKCGYVRSTTLSGDPMSSDALGWLASELKPPT